VTSVTARKGSNKSISAVSAVHSIGYGGRSGSAVSCGTITIGGTVYWDGSSFQNGGATYLSQSTLIYEP
jgi:hypothetical protein